MGLAPLVVRKVFATIVEINKAQTPILLVEQNANEALRIAHRGYVIETGVITHQGPAASLQTDPKVRHAYLGITG